MRDNKRMMARVSYRMHEKDVQRVKNIAKVIGISESELVRSFVMQALDGVDPIVKLYGNWEYCGE